MLFEWILRIIIWIVQFLAVFGIPIVICIFLYHKSYRKLAAAALLISFLLVSVLVNFPPVLIPDEYAAYVNQDTRTEIQQLNNGFYSRNIPVIPVYISVLYADESLIRVRTHYYLFGTTEMEWSRTDEPSLIKGLFR